MIGHLKVFQEHFQMLKWINKIDNTNHFNFENKNNELAI